MGGRVGKDAVGIQNGEETEGDRAKTRPGMEGEGEGEIENGMERENVVVGSSIGDVLNPESRMSIIADADGGRSWGKSMIGCTMR